MQSALQAYDLRTESRSCPLGIDERAPRFSWRLAAEEQGARQTAYRLIVVVSGVDAGVSATTWDTGWVSSSLTANIEYTGDPLAPATRYEWSVQLRDASGIERTVGTSWFETGLFDPSRHDAAWIHRNQRSDEPFEASSEDDVTATVRVIPPAAHLRGAFECKPGIVRARVYATAHGLYRLFVNGERVGDHELAPGWTDYRDRVMYQSYDVTDLVHQGPNAVGMIVADGWWSGYVGFDRRHQAQHYGEFPEAWALVCVDYDDGTSSEFGTGGSWQEHAGAIRYADLLMGEYVDARLDLGAWTAPEFDSSDWRAVVVSDRSTSTVVAMVDEPVRITQELEPLAITSTGSGTWLVDFGQNFVGRVRLALADQASGTRVQLRHAEILDEHGELYVANLRTVEAVDVFVTAGGATETFEPAFTVHGFRYVEISGVDGIESVTGVVLGNDIPWSGTVATSDPDINQLESNIRWTQRSNFLGVPTDCPQRDERLGWLGDAQLFFSTAALNADVQSFFARWLRDVRFGQDEEGSFPDFAPNLSAVGDAAPGWGDAGVIVPWKLYRAYGDIRVLADSFDAMRRWVDFVHRANPDLIWTHRVGNHYGDWLQIDAFTPREVLATAYFAHSTDLVARSAAALGMPAVAAEYAALANRIKDAFRTRFVDADSRITGDTQTAYLLALQFELLPRAERTRLGEHLVRTVEDHGFALTTGIIGVPLLLPALCDIGRSDLAFTLIRNEGFPSWLYSVRQGATTIWERWDGDVKAQGAQHAQMNSFNHYALGAVGEWLYRYVAGIDQSADSVGYETLMVTPHVGGGLTSARASYTTPFGLVSSSWELVDDQFTLTLTVPPGSTAIVTVPASPPVHVGSGRHEFTSAMTMDRVDA